MMKQKMLFENETTNSCKLLPSGPLDVDLNVRALSWKQPFAELMLPPYDKIETRIWPTNYRGWVLICASQSRYSEMDLIDISGEVQTQRIFNSFNARRQSERLAQAIGIGYLTDCRPMQKADENRCFVQYKEPWMVRSKKTGYCKTKRLWVHVYENVSRIECIEWKGKQGWSTLTPEQKAKIVVHRDYKHQANNLTCSSFEVSDAG